MLTLYTFGDSILDCGRYNDRGVHPGQLPIRPVLLGNVYDPTFGDDAHNFLDVDPALARANLQRVNQVIAELAKRYGGLVDLHGHFLQGDPAWFTRTIEPSLSGASEVRRCFWPAVLEWEAMPENLRKARV